MSTTVNALKTSFIASIVAPAELKTVKANGRDTLVLNLRLVVNEWRPVHNDPKGEQVASWVNYAMWGDAAKNAAETLMVNDYLNIQGARIFPQPYIGKDGEAHYSLDAKGGHVDYLFRRNLSGEYNPVDPDHYVDPSKRAAAKAAAETAPTVNDADMALFQEFLAAKKAAESGPIELDPRARTGLLDQRRTVLIGRLTPGACAFVMCPWGFLFFFSLEKYRVPL